MAKARKDNKGRALRKGETYRKSDNSYMYKYTDPMGRKKYIYAQDLLTLREREKKLIKEQLDGLDVYIAGNATINFLFDRYMSVKTGLRDTTKSTYLYMYDHFVRNGFGDRRIAEIKYSDVLAFYIKLMDEKDLKIGTIDSIHTVLRPSFQLAVRDNIIRNNPCDGVMAELKKKSGNTHGMRHALTPDQQTAFVNYLEESPFHNRWRPLFVVMLGTGMRIGEVLGLRWDDIDLDKRNVSVNHSLTYYARHEGSSVCTNAISLPKTEAGIRNIPVIDAVYDAFNEQKEYSEEVGGCVSEIDGMSGFVFFNRNNQVHKPSAVNKVIRAIIENYNSEEVVKARREHREPVILPHFSCHHLRHTFCSRLCEADVNLKVIQQIMGHKDIQTTMDIYAEVSEAKKQESMKEVADKFNGIL